MFGKFVAQLADAKGEELNSFVNLLLALQISLWCLATFCGLVCSGLLLGYMRPTLTAKAIFLSGAFHGSHKDLLRSWHRLFTASILHVGLLHLALNAYSVYSSTIVLYIAGYPGQLCIFGPVLIAWSSVSATAICSVGRERDTYIALGASGGTCAFSMLSTFAAMFSKHAKDSRLNTMLFTNFLLLIIQCTPLASLMSTSGKNKIDYNSHLAGALLGIVAFVMLERLYSPTRDVAFVKTALLLTLFTAGIYLAAIVTLLMRSSERARQDDILLHLIVDRKGVVKPKYYMPRDEGDVISLAENVLLTEKMLANDEEFMPKAPRNPKSQTYNAYTDFAAPQPDAASIATFVTV